MNKIILHDKVAFEGMRIAGNLAARTLDFIEDYIKPGVTTEYLDQLCAEFITKNNGISAPLGYRGFPKSICTSINHVVCHGIPSQQTLSDGDIVNIDVTPIVDGWYGDSSRMYLVGESFNKDPKTIKAKRLTLVTYNAMMQAIAFVKPGILISDIGKIIQNYVEKYGFSVTRDFCGHGIGQSFHTDPQVPHYYNKEIAKYTDSITLKAGMIFTIEPMINAGTWEVLVSRLDNWTVTTRDKQLSAQFEHTIGVTEFGYEIFTLSSNGNHYPKILDDLKL